jgi:site-specific recombinase XerD
MKLNYSFSILFWLYKGKMKNNLCPIYVRITIDGKRTEISTKKWINENLWNKIGQNVKGNTDEARAINQYLNLLKGDIEKIYLRISADERIPNPDEIKSILLGETAKPNHKTICEAFDYHNLKMSEIIKVNKISAKTLERYEITKNKVIDFMQKVYKIDDKALPELRLSFVSEFEHFLLTKHKIQSNTAHKYIKNLKKVMNMAVGLDWIPSNPFNQFKCSYHNPEREILTQEELNLIMEKQIFTPRLAEVRDVFIFCCYTGFAYTDVYKFKNDAMIRGIDGEYWLSTNRQKTGTRESVPLLPVPMQIIEKYRENEYCNNYNKLLPVNSNQRYNNYLKELAEICGIKKHLTTHTARHTFATTVTLANGVPIETVSSMLGHNSIRTTQVYAKVIEKKVSDDMKALKEKFNIQKSLIYNVKINS